MKALLINGPPRAGKDTIAEILSWDTPRHLPLMYPRKFAEPIVDFMLREYSIHMPSVEKDKPHPVLQGRTPREVAIAYSEKFCKPLYGVDYFGYRAVEALKEMKQVLKDSAKDAIVVYSDSGFVHEAIPILEFLGEGNVLRIHLSRPGHNFTSDSRGYWDHPRIGFLEFENDCQNLDLLKAKVRADLLPELSKWVVR